MRFEDKHKCLSSIVKSYRNKPLWRETRYGWSYHRKQWQSCLWKDVQPTPRALLRHDPASVPGRGKEERKGERGERRESCECSSLVSLQIKHAVPHTQCHAHTHTSTVCVSSPSPPMRLSCVHRHSQVSANTSWAIASIRKQKICTHSSILAAIRKSGLNHLA